MNRIDITLDGLESPPWLEEAEPFIQAILGKLGKHNWDLSILFCTNEIIRNLNKQYRSEDKATDVLSFIMAETAGEQYLPGDIAVSIEMMEENAKYLNISPQEELRRLLIHGILHLAGMDHATNDKEETMLILQEKLLKEHC